MQLVPTTYPKMHHFDMLKTILQLFRVYAKSLILKDRFEHIKMVHYGVAAF